MVEVVSEVVGVVAVDEVLVTAVVVVIGIVLVVVSP